MDRLLRCWSGEVHFDAALASSSGVAGYLARAQPGVPAVVDLIDVDSQKWFDYADAAAGLRSWVYRQEGRRVRRLETELAGWARALTVVSEREAELLRPFCPREVIHVVPNGVDLNYFRPAGPPGPESGAVFVGALDYRPNVDAASWFCQEVWPLVRRLHPNAMLRLVGRKPVPEVLRLQAVPGVEVVGQVPDVRPYLADAAVAVAPLRIARGVQNKVLEALAMGKAVVGSPQALGGLPRWREAPVLCATSVTEWVEQVCQVLADEELLSRLGAQGRQYAEDHFNWERCLSPFAALLGLAPVEQYHDPVVQVSK
jgi:sugar transferase (PEP-CTERM/EpsH1 system associated)